MTRARSRSGRDPLKQQKTTSAATIEAVPLELSTPVKFIKRVGERVAAGLAERGVATVEDLLYHLPFRYEDRLHPKPLSEYQPGDMASIIGEVRGTVLLRTRSGPIFEMTIGVTPLNPDPTTDPGGPFIANLHRDEWGTHAAPDSSHPQTSPSIDNLSGLLKPPPSQIPETIKCLWFHGSYLKDKFRPGQKIALYGKLEGSRSGNSPHAPLGSTKFKMVQPTFEILPDASATGEDAEFTMLEMARIVPVYESLGGKTPWGSKLTSRWLRRVMWTVFKELSEQQTPTQSEITQTSGAPSSPTVSSSAKVGSHEPHPTETLPTPLRERLNFPTRMEALRDLHFPPAGTSITELMSARTPAHRRLIFEEFWYLELGLELKRRRLREREGVAFRTDDSVRKALKQVLPFKPTAAQKRVLGEIVADMRQPHPMRRLLQGDVGSGKTIVAFQAALVAIENGCQVALMAPTEILATQHYLSARKLLGSVHSPRTGRPYRIALLTGSLDDRAKREVRSRLFRGEIDLAIGTHALVEESVDFANLGLVIVDEQHRFGVQQRFQLMRKPSAGTASRDLTLGSKEPGASEPGAPGLASKPGALGLATKPGAPSSPTASSSAKMSSHDPNIAPGGPLMATASSSTWVGEPDTLVMTATPIPRTLALTMYGDLEASVIDELPPGRSPILTRRMPEERSAEVWDFVRKQVDVGRQTFLVYPVIEGEKEDQPELEFAPDEAIQPVVDSAPKTRSKPARPKLRSATEMHDELQRGALAGLRLGLLHGRMSADDKEVTMARFKRGEIDVLVSTTVIEVGVDVPNATLMVIEHAERFGLAQMHQLRGRVGRGAAKSFCILLTGVSVSPEAEQRLDAMVRTQNGFELAELDLQQRGPGEFFGTRQAGLPEFRVANLARDREILELARTEAAHFVDVASRGAVKPDPALTRTEIEAVWSRLKQQWQRRYGLVEA
jgi:ATP-dependent DNA helicase RecG